MTFFEVEYRKKNTTSGKDKVTIAQKETIPNIWNGTGKLWLTDCLSNSNLIEIFSVQLTHVWSRSGLSWLLCLRPHRAEALSDDARLTSVCLSDVWHLSFAYIGSKSRTERPGKTKIGTEVAHVTRDSDTTFKVKRSKVKDTGAGHIVSASRTACWSFVVIDRGQKTSAENYFPWSGRAAEQRQDEAIKSAVTEM